MMSGPESIMSICMDWFETWVDIASGGFMGLFEGMSFSGGMSEWFLMELNITSVFCKVMCIMVFIMWFVRLNYKWSLMWLFSMWSHSGNMVISMSKIETVADIVVSKIVMSICSLPVMSVVDNSVSKTVIISLMSIIMAKSMINTTIDIMRSKCMSWLTIKAVLSEWSTEMGSKSIIICLCLFVICLRILKFSSESGLIFMWSQIMMSMWLIGINLFMMEWDMWVDIMM